MTKAPARPITLTIEGRFTVFELTAMVSFIRGLDRDQRHWSLLVNDPEGSTLAEAERLLREVMHEMPGRKTTFSVHRKQ